MKVRSWKLLLIIALTGLNTLLFIALQNKKEELREIHTELSKSPVNEYLENNNWNNALPYALTNQSVPDAQSMAIADASEALIRVIKEIRERYIHRGTPTLKINAVDYFSKKIAVDTTSQSALWNAFGKYHEVVSGFLEGDLANMIHYRDSLGRVMERELKKVETKFKTSPPGSKLQTTLYVHLRGTRYAPHAFDLAGIRMADSIQWERNNMYTLGYDDYFNLMIIMNRTAHSSKALQVSKTLVKMNSLFIERGKLDVYGKVYDLSAVTEGELESVCKHVLLLQWRANEGMLAAFRELSRF